jgi:hypothetical protein
MPAWKYVTQTHPLILPKCESTNPHVKILESTCIMDEGFFQYIKLFNNMLLANVQAKKTEDYIAQQA